MPEVICKTVAVQKNSQWPCSMCPIPQFRRVGVRTSHIFPAFVGCHSKSEQAWPCGMDPVISKLSHRHCNQGELPPSYIHGGTHSHIPGLKHSHSYVTYPWNQLKIMDMLNDHAWGYLQNLLCNTTLNGPAPCGPYPSLDLWGWGHPIFLIFPGHPEFWTPLQILLWGAPWLHPLTLTQNLALTQRFFPSTGIHRRPSVFQALL